MNSVHESVYTIRGLEEVSLGLWPSLLHLLSGVRSSRMSDVCHEQGYDALLLDIAKSRLMCSECDLVLRDAVLTIEGNRLCLPCFKKIEK